MRSCKHIMDRFFKLQAPISLANATSHWIQLLDSAFIQALRFKSHLGWKQSRNPALSDLYSRRDFDHARRLINILQFAQFPSGTGFEDMFKLYCRMKTPYWTSVLHRGYSLGNITRHFAFWQALRYCTISVDSETLHVLLARCQHQVFGWWLYDTADGVASDAH